LTQAHFFNVNDNWCSQESFGIIPTGLPSPFPAGNQPKLSVAVREAVNDLTEQLNYKIEITVASFEDSLKGSQADRDSIFHVKYIPITAGFDGHRFCEDNHSKVDNYLSGDVWFWNVSPPGIGATADSAVADQLPGNFDGTYTETPHLLDFSEESLSDPGVISFGWQLRPFHPKYAGHTVIKDAIVARLRADGISGVIG